MDDAFHAPAYLEFTKASDELLLAMLYEIADMMISDLKQIEMENTKEPTPDIDSCDAAQTNIDHNVGEARWRSVPRRRGAAEPGDGTARRRWQAGAGALGAERG